MLSKFNKVYNLIMEGVMPDFSEASHKAYLLRKDLLNKIENATSTKILEEIYETNKETIDKSADLIVAILNNANASQQLKNQFRDNDFLMVQEWFEEKSI